MSPSRSGFEWFDILDSFNLFNVLSFDSFNCGQSSSENSSTYRLSGLASGLRYPQLQRKPLFEM
jgi:hypothetical protein